MTKPNELKAAYEAATPGEWDYFIASNADRPNSQVLDSNDDNLLTHSKGITGRAQSDVLFIALAHNNMAALLEAAVELGRFVEYLGVAGCDGAYDREIERAVNLLENLK